MNDTAKKRVVVRRELNKVMDSLVSRRMRPGAPDGKDTARRVLRSLFARSGRNAIRLRKAMLTSRDQTRQVLTELNAARGKASDPHFSDDQISSLQMLLFDSRFAPMAPVVDARGASGVPTIQKEVLRFWTELLSKNPAEVEDLHHRVTDYCVHNSPEKLARVLAILRAYAPDGRWTQHHADALAAINTTHIQFKSLAWVHFPGVYW
jgi:hypothetical protein